MMVMTRIIAASLLSIAFTATLAPAGWAGSDVTRPYYYLGAGRTLSPLDQQQLTIYRDQLETQQRAQQLQLYGSTFALPNSTGPLRPLGGGNPATASQSLNRTQIEFGRVNGLLTTSRTNQMLATPPAMVVKRFPPQ